MLTRRQFLAAGLASAAAVTGACSSGSSDAPRGTKATEDFSSRFARFKAAAEPNGDLAKVVWPDFVTDAGPDVKRLYEFQITNGELMRYIPCFCGCGQNSGHHSNRDCYVERVNDDGSVVLDTMAPTWGICLGVTRDVMRMLGEGKSRRAIRAAIDQSYADRIEFATPTPYPPA
jgi:hypothetical protein